MYPNPPEVYYYAIREIQVECAEVINWIDKQDALSRPVSYIARSNDFYAVNWIHKRTEGLHRFLNYLEPWEYDMLKAFDIPVVDIKDALNPMWEGP